MDRYSDPGRTGPTGPRVSAPMGKWHISMVGDTPGLPYDRAESYVYIHSPGIEWRRQRTGNRPIRWVRTRMEEIDEYEARHARFRRRLLVRVAGMGVLAVFAAVAGAERWWLHGWLIAGWLVTWAALVVWAELDHRVMYPRR